MGQKLFYCLMVFVLPLTQVPQAAAITTDELADIIEQMESAIVDISLEYEWLVDTKQTLEERLKLAAIRGWAISTGPSNCKMVCSVADFDPNDPDALLFDKFLLEQSGTSMTKPDVSWNSLTKKSYNGVISKNLYVGGPQGTAKEGRIFIPDRPSYSWIFNPVKYFSIFRYRAIEKIPLSEMLRNGIVRTNYTVKRIKDFNTISVEFIDESTSKPFKRVLFSVDHGFTPVKYEDLNTQTAAPIFTVETTSLQKVGPGLWFPGSGVMTNHTDTQGRSNVYKATGQIAVDQGLIMRHFDIDFPTGTKVHDEIKGKEYVVK